MSLCPLSWRNIKRLSRQCEQTFVQASAHQSGDLLAVDPTGATWRIERRGKTPVKVTPLESTFRTTTSVYLRSRERSEPQLAEWYDEIDRRLEELQIEA